MKKLLITAIVALMLLPLSVLAQTISITDYSLPGLTTMVSGGNRVEYRMEIANTGQVPFIALPTVALTGAGGTCDGRLGNDPLIPAGTAEWQVDVAYEATGEAVWSAPMLCTGGGICNQPLPQEALNSGDAIAYTVIVVVPQTGLTGNEQVTLHAFMEDASTSPRVVVSSACEDIQVVPPGGLVTLTFIQVLLVGTGSILSILGVAGFFI